MLTYPVRIQPDGDGFLAEFRDIPEALTGGASVKETLHLAADALLTAMDFYFEDQRPVPMPTDPQDGEELIELPASLTAKVYLLNEMINQRVKPAELARKMEVKPQEVNRLLKLNHTTKIDTISNALEALGKKLEVNVV